MLVFVFLWMQMCVSLLTSTLVLEWFLIWAILYPDELSTQDCAPYSRVTGMEAGSWWTRSSIGLLAQPKDSVMALKPTSPLGWRKRKRRLSLLSNQNRIFNMEGWGGWGGVSSHTLVFVRYSGRCTGSWCRHQTDLQTSFWNQDGICSPSPDLDAEHVVRRRSQHYACHSAAAERCSHFLPNGPAALITASGLKRVTTARIAFTQRGGDGLFTTSVPWPCWFWTLGRSGKPQGSTRIRCDTLWKRKQNIITITYSTMY